MPVAPVTRIRAIYPSRYMQGGLNLFRILGLFLALQFERLRHDSAGDISGCSCACNSHEILDLGEGGHVLA